MLKYLILLVSFLPLFNLVGQQDFKRDPLHKKADVLVATLPVRFVENKGQMRDMAGKPIPIVLFRAEAPGMQVYVTEQGLTYVFATSGAEKENHAGWERVDMTLLGASISKQNVRAEGAMQHRNQYFYAHCHAGITDVAEYTKITIREVYPGIDWVLYNAGTGGFKYDFIVHPSANAGNIRMLYASLQVPGRTDGGLVINTGHGTLQEQAPYTYLAENNVMVNSSFVVSTMLKRDHQESLVHFKLDKFNPLQTLVIDPQLVWSTLFGGGNVDKIKSIDTDASGNLFVTGYTTSVDFPTKGNVFQGSLSPGPANADVFILKFSNAGALTWATYYGGSKHDESYFVATDQQGNVFVTGSTGSVNFPNLNAGTFFQGTHGGGTPGTVNEPTDAFLLKFDNNGNRLWSTYIGGGGPGDEIGNSLAIDATGNVFVTGVTSSVDFPVLSAGTYFNGTYGGQRAGFIMKFTNLGVLNWSTYFGVGNITCNAVAVHPTGDLLLTGYVDQNSVMPVVNLPGAINQASSAGNLDAFVARFSNAGALNWCTYLGGSSVDKAYSLAVDQWGGIFICGTTSSQNFPLVNSGAYFQGALSVINVADAFIVKLSPGNLQQWGTYYGGSIAENMTCTDNLAVDNCGSVYMTFWTGSFNVPTRKPCDNGPLKTTNSATDVFFTRFSGAGALLWGTYFGGNGTDADCALAIDNAGNLFAAGNSNNSITLPLVNPGTPAHFDNVLGGSLDGFISKYTVMSSVPTQSFAYTGTICTNGATVAPTTSGLFVGGGTYQATPPTLAISAVSGTINPAASTAGTYVINYSGASCGCLVGPPLTATISVLKSLSLTVTSGTSCPGIQATLNAVSNQSVALQYQWSNGSTASSIVVSPPSDTQYIVFATVGSCSASAVASVVVSSTIAPKTTFKYGDVICTNHRVTLPDTVKGFASGGLFSVTDTIRLNPDNGEIKLHDDMAGTYIVTYSVPGKGCRVAGTSTAMVTINKSGTLTTNPYVTMKPGEGVRLKVTGGDSYEWSPPDKLSCTDCDNPLATPVETTTYCVTGYMDGCYTGTCIVVEVLCGNGGDLSLPNAFTPNGDGQNDVYCLQGWSRCNTAFDIKVYNRWGEMVYESDKPSFCWDGNFNGQPLASGVYVYTLHASFVTDEPITKTGNITLVR